MVTGRGIKTGRGQNITILAGVFEGGLLVLALAIGGAIGHPPLELVQPRWSGLVWGTIATVPLIAVVWAAVRSKWHPIHRFIQEVEEKVYLVVGDLSRTQVVLIAGLAGVAEELMFRGLIQPGLGRLFDPMTALIITSVLFGVAHLVTITYAVIAAIMGLYLGWIAVASGNLLVPIIAHALYDWWALTYLIEHRGQAIRHRMERADVLADPTSS